MHFSVASDDIYVVLVGVSFGNSVLISCQCYRKNAEACLNLNVSYSAGLASQRRSQTKSVPGPQELRHSYASENASQVEFYW